MIPGDDPPYTKATLTCWRCGTEILVYTWEGKDWMDDVPPPTPAPPSLKFRRSRMARCRYWANVCSNCDSVQGENFIYQPRGPLPHPESHPLYLRRRK